MSITLTDQEADIILFALSRLENSLVQEQDVCRYERNTMREVDLQKTRRRLDSAITKIRLHSSTSVGTNFSEYF